MHKENFVSVKETRPEPPMAPSTSTGPAISDGPPPGLGFDELRRPSKPIVISLGPIAGHEEEKVGLQYILDQFSWACSAA